MRYQSILLKVVLVVSLIAMAGCFSSNPHDIEAFTKPDKVLVTAENYILQPPDEIEIHCSKVPEIHLQRQQIRPDGKVMFEALGEVTAAGKTPKELAELLREKILLLYALTGENPVDVRVVAYRSNLYYVLGQVYYYGPRASTGRDTVLTALAYAQPTVLGWTDRIQVIRPSSDKNVRPRIFELDYKKMTQHGDTSKNVLLQEGDIIYVPPTILAAIGMVVEEMVRPIVRAFATVNIIQGPPPAR